MDNKNQIIITDPLIVSYYRENPNIDVITMNHIFIDILKSLSTNLSSNINNTINQKILSLVTEINSNNSSIKNDINSKLNDYRNDVNSKLHEYKKEYIEDVKIILTNSILTNEKNIGSLIEKNNENLLAKTTVVINEVVPKNQDKSFSQIENCIKSFCSSISNDITKVIDSIPVDSDKDKDDKIKEIIINVENQINKMVSTIQQPIFSFIQLSEERTNNGIQQLKDNLNTQVLSNNKLSNEINDFLNKYKNNSSTKGNVSETELYYLLQTLMPTDEIVKVSTDTASCDFKVNRKDTTKPTILFENKDYSRSVNSEEIKKFERDVLIQKNHGIMLSQQSPITFKDPFQIDIINGFIHVYLPNVQYNMEKIKIAIDIIDNLSLKLDSICKDYQDDDFTISKQELEDIIEEHKFFGIQKSQMIDMIKNVTKQLIDKMEEIQLPKIKKILIKAGNIENDNGFKCSFCNNWSGKNKASLGAHLRNCKLNPKNKDSNANSSDININTEINSSQLPTSKKIIKK